MGLNWSHRYVVRTLLKEGGTGFLTDLIKGGVKREKRESGLKIVRVKY